MEVDSERVPELISADIPDPLWNSPSEFLFSVQNSLNFGFIHWTISINFDRCYMDSPNRAYSFCYTPSVSIITSVLPIIPYIPTLGKKF